MLGISYKFNGVQMEPAWFHEDDASRTAANSFYMELKAISGVTDIKVSGAKKPESKPESKPETKPKTKIALVAFKIFGYEVPGDTEEGDYVTVMSGGEPIQLEVLRVTTDRKPGVKYIPAEEVIHK